MDTQQRYDYYITTMLAEIAVIRVIDQTLAGILEELMRLDAADMFGLPYSPSEQRECRAELERYMTINLGSETIHALAIGFLEQCCTEITTLLKPMTVH